MASTDSSLQRTTLPNGLTVLSEYVPGVRSVAFGTWVRAASIHEPRERMGVSHLLEHMVFKGTAKRSARHIALALEALGGSLDAYTAREHTSFQARVLDEHLEIAADVIADLIFQPLLRTEDLDLERNVVLEEISMVEDTPDDLVFELQNELMWGAHPYGYSILGTRETVTALGVPDLRDLHGRAYHPPRLVVVAAGNVRHDDLLATLDRTGWAAVPRGPDDHIASPAPKGAPPERRHVTQDLTQTHLVMASPTVSHKDARRHAVMLVSMVLGGGMSSRLFQRVREELGLAYSIHTFQSFHADTGIHGIYVATGGDTAARAESAIREELDAVVADGIRGDELAQAKAQLKGQITLSLEGVSSRMYRAASIELYGDELRTLDDLLAAVDAISEDDVASVCSEYFRPERQTVVSLGPEPH